MIASVSIVIPTYNRPALVQRAVESALSAAARSHLQLEVTVVDNASAESPERSLKARFGDAVRVVVNERNVGVTGNWNRCREIAERSDCDAWLLLEDDNYLEPSFFDEVLAAFKEVPDADIVFTACTNFDDHGTESSWRMWSVAGGLLGAGRLSDNELLGWAFTCAMKISSVVVRRKQRLAGLPRFSEDHYSCQDVSGLCELALAAGAIAYVPEPVMRYYLNPLSVTASARTNARLAYSELLRAVRENVHRLALSDRFSRDAWAIAAAHAPVDRLILAVLALYGPLSPELRAVRSTLVNALMARNGELKGWRRAAGAILGKLLWGVASIRAARIARCRRADIRTADYHSAAGAPVGTRPRGEETA